MAQMPPPRLTETRNAAKPAVGASILLPGTANVLHSDRYVLKHEKPEATQRSASAAGDPARLMSRRRRCSTNYQNRAGPLITPDRMAFRTSSIVARPPGAVPPH